MLQIRALAPNKCSNLIRFQCVQFIIMHWTTEATKLGRQTKNGKIMMPNYEFLEQFRVKQAKDFMLAWELLSTRAFDTRDLNNAAGVLKIDIAQRLEDPVKLSETFKDFTRRDLSHQDILVAITAAPFLADWKAVKNLVGKAEKFMGQENLNAQWHSMSQSMPIPDYSVLFSMAEEYRLDKRPTPNPKDLTWATIRIAKIRVKFAHVDCGPFKEKAAELLKQIRNAGIKWEEVPDGPNIHIKKMGGFFQTISFGELPISLCGPYVEAGRLHVIGTVEIVVEDKAKPASLKDNSQIDLSKVVLKREEWILERVPNSLPPVWKGTYIINQGFMKLDYNNPDTAPVNMAFEIEFYERGQNGSCHPTLEENIEEKVSVISGKQKDLIDDEKADIIIIKPAAKESGIETVNTVPKEKKLKTTMESVISDIDDLEMD